MRAGDDRHMSFGNDDFKKAVCNAAMRHAHGYANQSAFFRSQSVSERLERMRQL
jgi:hypothetical protein